MNRGRPWVREGEKEDSAGAAPSPWGGPGSGRPESTFGFLSVGVAESGWLHFKHGEAREAASTPRDWLWLLRQKHRHNMLPPFTFHTLPNISVKAAIKRNKISFKHLSSFQMFHLHKLFCCAYLHICHLHKDSLLNIFKIYCGWYSAGF